MSKRLGAQEHIDLAALCATNAAEIHQGLVKLAEGVGRAEVDAEIQRMRAVAQLSAAHAQIAIAMTAREELGESRKRSIQS